MIHYIRYHLRPEQEAEFLDTLQMAARYLESGHDCATYELARATDGAANYVLRVEWRGSANEARESAEFRGFFAAIQRYLSSAVEVGEYTRQDLT